jgi:radical SAM protein with 4Fe4S-binding SPASM domain
MLKAVNHLIYRLKYRYGRYLPLSFPVDVSLELSSSCNMACSYCYHADKENLPFKQGLMSKEVALKIVTQAANLGVHSLKFNWKGESTLNPHYREVTEYAKSLATGSTFIDRLANSNFKIHRSIRDDRFHGLAALTKVKVSYDSFTKDVFEKQRTKGDHDLTTENIDLFYNHPARIKSETQIVIQAVRTQLNRDEDIAGLCSKRWPEAEISIRDMVEGRVQKDLSGLTDRSRDASERQSCLQAHVRVIFNHKGLAFPCCPDVKEELMIGDINKQDLFEIFTSQYAEQLRDDLRSGKAFKLNPCRECSSFETYKGFKPSWNS